MPEYHLHDKVVSVRTVKNHLGLIDIFFEDAAGRNFLYDSLEPEKIQYFNDKLRIVETRTGQHCAFVLIDNKLNFFDLKKRAWTCLYSALHEQIICIDITQSHNNPAQLAIFILSDKKTIHCLYFNPVSLALQQVTLPSLPVSTHLITGLHKSDDSLIVAAINGNKIWYCHQNMTNGAQWEPWIISSPYFIPGKLLLQPENSSTILPDCAPRLIASSKNGRFHVSPVIQQRWRNINNKNNFTQYFAVIRPSSTEQLYIFATDKRGYLQSSVMQSNGSWSSWTEIYCGEYGHCSAVAVGYGIDNQPILFAIFGETLYRNTAGLMIFYSPSWVKCYDGCIPNSFIVVQDIQNRASNFYLPFQYNKIYGFTYIRKKKLSILGTLINEDNFIKSRLACPHGDSWHSIVTAFTHDRRIAVFACQQDGLVRHAEYPLPDVSLVGYPYSDLGKLDPHSPLACATDTHSRIAVFGLLNGKLRIRRQNSANYEWDDWQSLDGPSDKLLFLTAVYDADDCLICFSVDQGNMLWVCRQNRPEHNAPWEWRLLGTGFAGPVVACTHREESTHLSPPSAFPPDDVIDIFALTTGEQLAHMVYNKKCDEIALTELP
ncbi:hypothetical protein [Klebsiella quasivariicola]|uniref:hypothetical protein n=1 Tax=Klebsiella quasivariicola TaxID=2026240 RepID=UPI001CCE6037|nr:hypothetical protein [Klebsiella quasivariicola]MBZ9580989.1 hypothetical protein [Klebsiella quasivariicola]